jgi:TPR repeat protein
MNRIASSLGLGLLLAACTPASNAPGARIADFASTTWCDAASGLDWLKCSPPPRPASDIDSARFDVAIGRLYAEGNHVPKDEDRAFRLFEAGAKLDDPDALNALGECYAEERGVARDDPRAVALFRRAVVLGNVPALNNLGHMIETGRAGQPDLKQALALYEKGAAAGDDAAAANAARLKPTTSKS